MSKPVSRALAAQVRCANVTDRKRKRKMLTKHLTAMRERVRLCVCVFQAPCTTSVRPLAISHQGCDVCDVIPWYILELFKSNVLNESIDVNEQVTPQFTLCCSKRWTDISIHIMLVYSLSSSSNLITSNHRQAHALSLKALNDFVPHATHKWTLCALSVHSAQSQGLGVQ